MRISIQERERPEKIDATGISGALPQTSERSTQVDGFTTCTTDCAEKGFPRMVGGIVHRDIDKLPCRGVHT